MSDLLNQASLVMVPSGYKEDTVYSVVPSDGSGDLSFTRASNGTRVNSAGLVEVCPWNLLQNSENFDAVWTKYNGATVTVNAITAPNGTTTADLLIAGASQEVYSSNMPKVAEELYYTFSCYAKLYNTNVFKMTASDFSTSGVDGNFNLSTLTATYVTGATWSNSSASIESVGDGWYRCILTSKTPATTGLYLSLYTSGTNSVSGVYIWGAQVNIGSTAKPYFPTTDRLNVPRLTYQNGGGGCPSLLLEKQSTNLLSWSEDLTNAVYLSAAGAGGSITRTANYAISPDGTQNADRLQFVRGSSYAELYQRVATTIGVTYTFSFYAKSLSGTPTLNTAWNGTQANEVTFTTEWVRYTYTFVAASTSSGFNFITWTSLPNTSTTADILVWGVQLEASSYATSYIPTTSSSATRVADASFTSGLSALIGQTEGTLFAIISSQQAGSLYNWLNLSDNTVNNWVFIGKDSTKWRAYVKSNGSVIFDNSSISITNNTFTKIALAYKSGDIALYINGTQIATSSGTFTFSGTLSKVSIGDISNVVGDNAQYSEILVSKTRLTNAELASLTTI